MEILSVIVAIILIRWGVGRMDANATKEFKRGFEAGWKARGKKKNDDPPPPHFPDIPGITFRKTGSRW